MRKISTWEIVFARIFRIVAGKEYLLNIHWSVRRNSYSRPLHRTLIKIVLCAACLVFLGFACFTFEIGRWIFTEVQYRYDRFHHHEYLVSLQEERIKLGYFKTALDTAFNQEQKIRALYGINPLGSEYSSFGIGGRAHRDAGDSALSDGLYETLFETAQENRQLRGRMEFTLKNLRQMSEFVEYQNNIRVHTPSTTPAQGEWTSPFGPRVDPITGQHSFHEGLDIANNLWTPIYASADGIVVSSGPSEGYGNLVEMDHGNGFHTRYAHLERSLVVKGQLVKRYSLLGYMGSTGHATGVHLHYEVVHDGVPQNPEKFILPAGILVD